MHSQETCNPAVPEEDVWLVSPESADREANEPIWLVSPDASDGVAMEIVWLLSPPSDQARFAGVG